MITPVFHAQHGNLQRTLDVHYSESDWGRTFLFTVGDCGGDKSVHITISQARELAKIFDEWLNAIDHPLPLESEIS